MMNLKSKQSPKCSMCRNHLGDDAPDVKGHKRYCKYNNLQHISECIDGCQATKSRQETVANEKKDVYVSKKIAENTELPASPPGIRCCRKCRNHKKIIPVKNSHRLICDFKDCECKDCLSTSKRRSASTVFTKHYRQSKADKPKGVQSPPRDHNSPPHGRKSPDSGIGSSCGSPSSSDTSMAYSPLAQAFSPVLTTNDSMEFSPVEVLNVAADEIYQAGGYGVEEIEFDETLEMLYEIIAEDKIKNVVPRVHVN